MPPHRPRPPHHHPPHHGPHHHPPSSAVDASIASDALAQALAPFVPELGDRAFVARCIAEEGPIHHRGASYALIRLLSLALEAAGGPLPDAAERASVRVPMRLPPHLRRDDGEHDFPLAMPLAPLERVSNGDPRVLAALIDCLVDGPPHHALANAAMVALAGALLERLSATGS